MNNIRLFKNKRLYFISFFLIFLFFSTRIHAGEIIEKITLSFSNLPLSEAIKRVEAASKYTFFYDVNKTNLQHRVSLNATDMDIDNAIRAMLTTTDLTFNITNRQIALIPSQQEQEDDLQRENAKKRITGIVVDDKGEPVAGANIVEKGGTNGTVTEANGKFSLDVADNTVLQVSYIGYITQEIAVVNQSEFNIILREDNLTLEEIVVVGYGTQKKVNLTGAVAAVKMNEALGDRPIINASAALQGMVPGLLVSGNHQVGQNKSFQIRGAYTIGTQNSDGSYGATIPPLVLIDNVEGDISMLNPDDIETISVLKDAASSAIYGARGAGGVIIITTKYPKRKERFSLNYSNNISIESPVNLPEQVSLLKYFRMYQEAGFGGGKSYWADAQIIDNWIKYLTEYKKNPDAFNIVGDGIYKDTDGLIYYLNERDLYSRFLEKSMMHNHNISASGATDKIRFRISSGWTSQDGTLITDKDRYERTNIGVLIAADITSWFTQEADIKYSQSTRVLPNNSAGNLWELRLLPYTPEGLIPAEVTGLDGDYPINTPANNILYGKNSTTVKANSRIYTRSIFKPFKGFEAILEYTFDKNDVRYDNYTGQYVATSIQKSKQLIPGIDSYTKQHYFTDYNAINIYGTYDFSLNSHNLKLMAGFNQESSYYEMLEAVVQEQAVLEVPSMEGAAGKKMPKDSYSEYAVRGGFFRVNYNYRNKYLFEMNGRYDGSSKFPKENRFGFFPSVSAGWNISHEPFMQDYNRLEELKIRGSWGKIGNQSINPYRYSPSMALSVWDAGSTNWLNNGGQIITVAMPSMISNSFTWETVETINLGLDIVLLNARLRGTLDAYQRNTRGMLAPGFQLPAVVGTSAPFQNTADMRTRGWELAVNWNDRIGDVGYRIGANLTDYKSIITNYNNVSKLLTNFYAGQELGEIWGYVTDGFYTVDDFENTSTWKLKEGVTTIQGYNSVLRPGDMKFKNLMDNENSTNEINPGANTVDDPGDRKIIGNSTPRYQFGVTLGINYKNFDWSVICQGTGKRDYWLGNDAYFPFGGSAANDAVFKGVFYNQTDYWTPKDPENGDYSPVNPNSWLPRIYEYTTSTAIGSNSRQSDKYLSNAAYMRIKNMTLSYTIPELFMQKYRIDRLKIFVSIENPVSFSSLPKGFDPETLGWTYPAYRTTSFGLSITF
ncbi:MAG: TonB-dependent receptor [Tannerella sp.]|jgi:TonB-linked SusC/RagA family outer membrane protein|nr:TonB-dependent receptor [Tannerella sp.]